MITTKIFCEVCNKDLEEWGYPDHSTVRFSIDEIREIYENSRYTKHGSLRDVDHTHRIVIEVTNT